MRVTLPISTYLLPLIKDYILLSMPLYPTISLKYAVQFLSKERMHTFCLNLLDAGRVVVGVFHAFGAGHWGPITGHD